MIDQQLRRLAQRAGSVADVVDDNAGLALHIADHRHIGDLSGLLAALVDDGHGGIDPLGDLARAGDAADIGRDHHQIVDAALEVMLDIQRKDRRGVKVVHRDVEETLNLRGVKIQRQNPVDAGLGQQVGGLGARSGSGGRRTVYEITDAGREYWLELMTEEANDSWVNAQAGLDVTASAVNRAIENTLDGCSCCMFRDPCLRCLPVRTSGSPGITRVGRLTGPNASARPRVARSNRFATVPCPIGLERRQSAVDIKCLDMI